MKTDSLNRRKRSGKYPKGMNPRITPALLLLEGLRRYNPLPPGIAFEFYPSCTDYPSFQRRLTVFTHEKPGGDEQILQRTKYFNPEGVLNSEPVWYELSERGKRIAESRAANPIELPLRDHILHRAFNACIGASFEVAKPPHMELAHLEDILVHPDCPPSTAALDNPLLLPITRTRSIEGDRLLGFRANGGHDFYAVEVDRATETNRRTVYGKLDQWSEVLSRKLYKSFWGLPNLRIMFITTAPGRVENLLNYLRGKPFADRFLFKSIPDTSLYSPDDIVPDFDIDWRAPRRPLTELFTPWKTTKGTFDITQP